MDRRSFLQALAASAAAFGLDPDLLLYVPGNKKIFIPEVTKAPIGYKTVLYVGNGQSPEIWMAVTDVKDIPNGFRQYDAR